MKKLLFILIALAIILSCENGSKNFCAQEIQLSEKEIARGNIYYFHRHNYSTVLEYKVFKKYGLIDYLENYPLTTDSCFRHSMSKIIDKQIVKLNILDVETAEYKKCEETRCNNGYSKFMDSIYSPSRNIEYPIMKYPMNEGNFKESLIEEIMKIDTSFQSSSFWVVVNYKGNVEKIERYRKHSTKTDTIVTMRLMNTKWVPSLDNIDSIFVSSRIKFYISR